MNKDLTILVGSCDKNFDLIEIFFKVLKIKWPDCPYKIVLNTETKEYAFDGFNIECFCVEKNFTKKPKNFKWTDRLLANLKKIDTKYTLFILEDFYFKPTITNDMFEEMLDKIDKIKNFGALFLCPNESDYPSYYKEELGLFYRHRFNSYKVNATPAIWNTKALIKLIKKHKDPWEFERTSSFKALFSNKKFYCLHNKYSNVEESNPYFFDFTEQVLQGEFTVQAKKMLDAENIAVDYESRGLTEFYSDNLVKDYKIIRENKEKWHEDNYFLYGLNFLTYKFFFGFFRKIKCYLKKIFKK